MKHYDDIFKVKYPKLKLVFLKKGLQQVPEDIPSNTNELLLQNNQISQLISNNFIHLPNLEFVLIA